MTKRHSDIIQWLFLEFSSASTADAFISPNLDSVEPPEQWASAAPVAAQSIAQDFAARK